MRENPVQQALKRAFTKRIRAGNNVSYLIRATTANDFLPAIPQTNEQPGWP